MTCGELDQLLEPYLDGEFAPEERLEVEAHLASCTECSHRVHAARAFRTALRSRAQAAHSAVAAPDRLRQSVLGGVRREARKDALVGYLKLSAAAMALLAAGGLVVHYRHPPRERFLAEAAAWHAKDLPVEIHPGSSEQVEAWFGGKLDHHVSVPHLSHATLAGARLSNVLDRPAAYISYDAASSHGNAPRRVGLFVFDDAEGEVDAQPLPDVQVMASRGYNVALWREGEIVYELVSDLDEEDIRQLLQQREASQKGVVPALPAAPAQMATSIAPGTAPAVAPVVAPVVAPALAPAVAPVGNGIAATPPPPTGLAIQPASLTH